MRLNSSKGFNKSTERWVIYDTGLENVSRFKLLKNFTLVSYIFENFLDLPPAAYSEDTCIGPTAVFN